MRRGPNAPGSSRRPHFSANGYCDARVSRMEGGHRCYYRFFDPKTIRFRARLDDMCLVGQSVQHGLAQPGVWEAGRAQVGSAVVGHFRVKTGATRRRSRERTLKV
jgi:hypothetical protein